MYKQIMRHINHHIQRMNEFCMPCSRGGCLAFGTLTFTHKFCVLIQTNQTRCQDFCTSFPRLRSPQKGFALALSAKEGDSLSFIVRQKGRRVSSLYILLPVRTIQHGNHQSVDRCRVKADYERLPRLSPSSHCQPQPS